MNYIPIDVLFAKIVVDLDLKDKNPDTGNWIEWTAEALRKIGAFPQFVIRNAGIKDEFGEPTILEVKNYQTRVPDDFVKETIVSYSETESGTYYVINPNIRTADYVQQNVMYAISLPYLRLNTPEGFVQMSYKAMPCQDNTGYPMVPDTEEFKEAIMWYIEMKLMYQEVRRNKEGATWKYQNAREQWERWKYRAYGDAMMPQSQEELNDIARVWLRSVPRWNSVLIDGSIRAGRV